MKKFGIIFILLIAGIGVSACSVNLNEKQQETLEAEEAKRQNTAESEATEIQNTTESQEIEMQNTEESEETENKSKTAGKDGTAETEANVEIEKTMETEADAGKENTAGTESSAGTGNAAATKSSTGTENTAGTESSTGTGNAATTGKAVEVGKSQQISGYELVDGDSVPVKVTFTLKEMLRGEEAYRKLTDENTGLAEAPEGMEYVVADIQVSYDEGEAESLYLAKNEASLQSAKLLFTLSNGDSNGEDLTENVADSFYNLELQKGETGEGIVVFLHNKDSEEPLYFTGFDSIVQFDIKK